MFVKLDIITKEIKHKNTSLYNIYNYFMRRSVIINK